VLIRVNLIKWFVVLLYCQTAQVKQYVLLCLLKVLMLKQLRAAGADVVGFDDLATSIQGGNLDFDVVIATPDAMRVVGKLGTILGPRGLMPNPKVGTVTADVALQLKMPSLVKCVIALTKAVLFMLTVGQVGFSAEAIKQNVEALIADLKKAKPATSKGVYVKKVTLSTTMGPGLAIDQATLATA
jgi:large subunit ribosomal protein L1